MLPVFKGEIVSDQCAAKTLTAVTEAYNGGKRSLDLFVAAYRRSSVY